MDDERTENPLRGRDLVGLGGLLVAAVVGGMVLGLVYDNSADSSPVGVLIGIAVGVLVGIVGFWLRVRSALRD